MRGETVPGVLYSRYSLYHLVYQRGSPSRLRDFAPNDVTIQGALQRIRGGWVFLKWVRPFENLCHSHKKLQTQVKPVSRFSAGAVKMMKDSRVH